MDTGMLRDHVSKLRQKKRIAIELYENVAMMRTLSDPALAYQYTSILSDIQKMIDYFTRMPDALAQIEDEATLLSQDVGGIIETHTEDVRRAVSSSFAL
ncbi:MAG: hypothetical protein IJP27_10175 [Clostridia bacterium]|nr:hypothetical protein [Clostridia bacterium]